MATPQRANLERHGVRIAYERTGAAEGTPLALLPAWMITTRRLWAAQVEHLADRHPLILHDARGSGGSDRPTDPAAYALPELVADAVAVLDATGTGRAVLVGHSFGGLVAYLTAVLHPDRVAGLVLIAPTIDVAGGEPTPLQTAIATFDGEPAGTGGWSRYNRGAWRTDFPGFVRWFTETALGAEADGEQRAAALLDGLGTTPEVLAATVAARSRKALTGRPPRCPALIVHGDRDAINPTAWSAALAALLDAPYEVLPGAGHTPQVTRAAETAHLIETFLKELA
ncbi:alpha/beta fold hydrolase [Virgisporangium ochraceum]|uniref:O-methylpimelyl-ACP methylesterase n=1 Tax=Virgisporangium ochraceum TaxID=65505 RepID=A0A8J4EC53_9ACTN|nr:alpha/beta hydrolase [Virgisporangium ochraceum]GIJ70120.1 O-methylpimelyl-ACP methylesterase [Virgisporangium ochraceum]